MTRSTILKTSAAAVCIIAFAGCTDLKPIQAQIDDLKSQVSKLHNDTAKAQSDANAAMIRQIAAADPGVTVCDTFSALALPDGSTIPEDFVPDRLHLNAAGYAVWRTVLSPIVSGWKLGPK